MRCIFRFLQSRRTYLWDTKNKIAKNDRALIIGLMKEMVFAENTENLQDAYDNFVASKIVSKYPHLLKYFEGFWSRKSEWALALRKHLMLRGNNTKNISEAGIRILKEIIFQRVQAFNLVQIFDFITIFIRINAASYCPPPTRQPHSSPVQGHGNKQSATSVYNPC